MSTAELVERFFGRDPLLGEDAYLELVARQGTAAIETLIPLQGKGHSHSVQVVGRLKAIAERLGASIAPYLARVIAEGNWFAKMSAAACYAGLDNSPEIEEPLLSVLRKSGDFDAERMAIEALTFLGADRWAMEIVAHSKSGFWDARSNGPSEMLSIYPFEKLSSYALEALARFVANARSRDRVGSLFELLTEFIELREEHLSNRVPTSYQLVQRHTPRFTGWVLDPMIELWGRSTNESLRRLCMDTLAEVVPLRGGRFLLDTVTDAEAPQSVRTGASIALGELRNPAAARLVSERLRDSAFDRSHLDWAFSTLYAVRVDWPNVNDYVDDLLACRNEVSARLAYSLALRGERRIENLLVSRLDDNDPFHRWTAALALARLLGPASRDLLQGRDEEASDELERCGMAAAALRSGDEGAAERLHAALQAFGTLSRVQSVWQIELLEAFRTGSEFNERAVRLWRAAVGMNPRKLQYFDALTSRPPAEAPAREVAVAPLPRRKLFISYSHRDAAWLQRFQIMLRPLLDDEQLSVWDDTKLVPGKWRDQIDDAMRDSQIALFLVSSHFLGSEFITRHELPSLVRYAADERRVQILWVLLDDCIWEGSALADYQGENVNNPLTLLSEGERSRAIKNTCQRIGKLFS